MTVYRTALAAGFMCGALFAQSMRTAQPTNYLREGPGSYYQIITALPAAVPVTKLEQKGSWLKVSTEAQEQGWLSENSFVQPKGTAQRDKELVQRSTSSRASRAELAAAVKGFGMKYVEGTPKEGSDISKFAEPLVSPASMEEFEQSFSVEPYRGQMEVEKPFDIRFHEEGIGLGIALRIIAQRGVVNDRSATGYLNKVGNHLARYTRAYDLGFRFYILKDERAAAFAIPGGYIFITKGMFLSCSNEAELAAVLAHEMHHVVRRHGVKELTKSAAKIRSESAYAELEEETGPMGEDEQELEEYADNVYHDLIAPRLLTYETDADRRAMVTLKRAGYDPTALLTVLQRIQVPTAATKDIFDDSYMKKDDLTERIAAVKSVIKEEGYASRTDRQYADRYRRNAASLQ